LSIWYVMLSFTHAGIWVIVYHTCMIDCCLTSNELNFNTIFMIRISLYTINDVYEYGILDCHSTNRDIFHRIDHS
jgi:hypothetical protein